ncbi:hypothetical protein HRbin30_02292 [bacterium HR30]|nr:hypothetical protein HRbin30_02292 [bacterium HR30]
MVALGAKSTLGPGTGPSPRCRSDVTACLGADRWASTAEALGELIQALLEGVQLPEGVLATSAAEVGGGGQGGRSIIDFGEYCR